MRAQPEAEALLDSALADLPNSPWGLHARAILRNRAGDFAAALSILRRVIALHPGLGGVHASLHDALLGLGHRAEAIEALREEVRRQPHRIPFRMRLLRHGDVAQTDAILALQPAHPQALRRRGGQGK
jgi:predicted Zn-dependent protease